MRRLAAFLPVLLCVLLAGCERRPLVDVGNTHYVRVYLDEELKNVTTGFYDPTLAKPEYKTPGMLRVVLYDAASGKVAAERYLRNRGTDARGDYFDGYIVAPQGSYRLLAYNFGTESTLIRNDHLYHGAEAYTNEISDALRSRLSGRASLEEERIVYVPDHLLVDRNELLTTAYTMDIDTLRNASGDHFTAGSLVLSYYLQVRVRGIEWISSAVGLLTGMAGSGKLPSGDLNGGDPVTIYFAMQRRPAAGEQEGIIITTCPTLRKVPGPEK